MSRTKQPVTKNEVDFSYYEPVNWRQAQFHSSSAKHKLLIGGYGSGKTYPTIHEVVFHCMDHPHHHFLVCRNTWETLRDEIEQDLLDICESAGVIKRFNKTDDEMVLVNGCTIIFRPLSIKRANFKGMHLCGFAIDDPDVNKYVDEISFLYTRLRDTAKIKLLTKRGELHATKFRSIITANWEGKNWLWKHYMKDREEGGDGKFAYWLCPTTENKELPDDYIDDLAQMHSQEWMNRYVYCLDLDKMSGLVYPTYHRKKHHMAMGEMPMDKMVAKILCIDVGFTHATAVFEKATDGNNIYTYDEMFKRGITVSQLGGYLRDKMNKTRYNKVIIDPSSAKREQTSGTSVKAMLRKEFGIMTEGAHNAREEGVNLIRDLLQPAKGDPRWFVDAARCPNLHQQMESYRLEEPRDMDFDAMGYKETPAKQDDDAVDASRYGDMYLYRYLKLLKDRDVARSVVDRRWENRMKLRIYREKPGLREYHERKLAYKRLGYDRKRIKKLMHE